MEPRLHTDHHPARVAGRTASVWLLACAAVILAGCQTTSGGGIVPLSAEAALACLTLLDLDTCLWLDGPAAASEALRQAEEAPCRAGKMREISGFRRISGGF